jgi:hypothetical protein
VGDAGQISMRENYQDLSKVTVAKSTPFEIPSDASIRQLCFFPDDPHTQLWDEMYPGQTVDAFNTPERSRSCCGA